MARTNDEMIDGTGGISISRCTSTKGMVCRIEVNDELSNCRILDLELNFESLGNAMTGLAEQPVRFRLYAKSSRIGKRYEHKRERVKIPDPRHLWTKTDENVAILKEVLKPYEVDGWEARIDDAFNQHCYGKQTDDGFEVTIVFNRWVDKATPIVTEKIDGAVRK